MLEQGPKSQATSTVCSGGVSAINGSSDLDEHTLGSGGASGNQLSCSLPFEAEQPIVGPAWQAQPQVCDERREVRGSVSSHIGDDTGDDGSGDAEPFLPATAPRPVLNAYKERCLGDVIENEGHFQMTRA